MRRPVTSVALLLLICTATRSASADLVINVNYSGDPAYQAAFTSAAQTWQNLLKGYQNGQVVATTGNSSYTVGQTVSTVFINASIQAIDGAGGVLGSAGPTELALDAAGYYLSTNGNMQFDTADVANLVANGNWSNVILHEMAHVLGFGTLWSLNTVYTTGTGEFTGANATAAWHSEFGQLGTPDVELGGGTGTANAHWNEVDGGSGLTGITDSLGRDMRDELMTGWLNPNSFISKMTVASFRDIGFLGEATPEPGSMILTSIGLGALAVSRRRRRKNNDHSSAA